MYAAPKEIECGSEIGAKAFRFRSRSFGLNSNSYICNCMLRCQLWAIGYAETAHVSYITSAFNALPHGWDMIGSFVSYTRKDGNCSNNFIAEFCS